MTEANKNKLAAQIIKAEMLGDYDKVRKLKSELNNLSAAGKPIEKKLVEKEPSYSDYRPLMRDRRAQKSSDLFKLDRDPLISSDSRVKKFIQSTSSLSQMFVDEKRLTSSDEVKMFMKTASKFTREDMETKYFSEEVDDSQAIMNRKKKMKHGPKYDPTSCEINREIHELCDSCADRQAKHLVVDNSSEHVYLTLMNTKPFLSSLSNVVIRNNDHEYNSFVSATDDHQVDTEKYIESLRAAWKSKGYSCVITEAYFKNRRARGREFTSCGNHFQVHCLPLKEKYIEKARMHFKHALQSSGQEWSMNKKLIKTDGRRIQRCLPKGLSYFWICFDDLQTGFGHVIENEEDFSPYFGFEILSGLLDKNFNQTKMSQHEKFNEQFERCRDFKLLYSRFR